MVQPWKGCVGATPPGVRIPPSPPLVFQVVQRPAARSLFFYTAGRVEYLESICMVICFCFKENKIAKIRGGGDLLQITKDRALTQKVLF